MTSAVTLFYSILALYLLGLGVFVIVKKISIKKKIRRDLENAEKKQHEE